MINLKENNKYMMYYSNLELGKKIKELRKSKGLTQEELAEKIGIDDKHLSRIEKGYHSPKYNLVLKLSQVLDFNFFTEIETKDTVKVDKIVEKFLQILNKANESEKLYYLESLKHTQKCLKYSRNKGNDE